ncbi:MAG: SGNH/GDSL hydrolase family protein [Nocardioides sp.]|nr:SGNH/GDSL hydrolase family protein [Nocardioides sp.]
MFESVPVPHQPRGKTSPAESGKHRADADADAQTADATQAVPGPVGTPGGMGEPPPPPSPPAAAPLDEAASVVAADAQHVRPTIAFVIALVALLFFAQAQTPRVVVLAVFVVYVAIATLWVREQYAESLAGQLTAPTFTFVKWALLVVVVVIGAGLLYDLVHPAVPESWKLRPSTFYLAGILGVYFILGYTLARNRALIDDEPGPGKGLRWRLRKVRASFKALTVTLLLVGAVFAAGLLLLGRDLNWVAAPLVAVAVFAFPWVASLMSEHAIRHFTVDGADRRILAMLTGGVIAIASLVTVRLVTGNTVAVLGMAGLLLLIFALASFTLADIAVVLAVVALMGLTPRQDKELPAPPAAEGNQVLVSLGDSYMSGEGAGTFIVGTDEGDANECRRARTAWAPLAGSQPPFDRVVFLACSGADTYNIRRTIGFPQKPAPAPATGEELTQLEAYDLIAPHIPEPALVVLSIGGNDAGFASIGLTCLAPGDCNDPEPERLWSDGNLDRVENRLRQTYEEVASTFAESPVAVVPYPSPIDADNAPCPEADLSEGDVQFIGDFLTKLNDRIRAAARDYGFYVVENTTTALTDSDLRLCDPDNNGRPGLNFIGLRSVGGLAGQRFNPTQWHHNSLHPNERGHAALHVAFQRWLETAGGLDKLVKVKDRINPDRLPPVSEKDTNVAGKCWTFNIEGDDGCKAQSENWAARSAAAAVLLWGIPVALVLLIAWVGSVAFFGWRRSEAARRRDEELSAGDVEA